MTDAYVIRCTCGKVKDSIVYHGNESAAEAFKKEKEAIGEVVSRITLENSATNSECVCLNQPNVLFNYNLDRIKNTTDSGVVSDHPKLSGKQRNEFILKAFRWELE